MDVAVKLRRGALLARLELRAEIGAFFPAERHQAAAERLLLALIAQKSRSNVVPRHGIRQRRGIERGLGHAGADAMHAWVLVWCGADAGWCGLDPTNGIFAADDHIVLAIGRDYADVAPIDGVIVASGGQRLEVSVRVTPTR